MVDVADKGDSNHKLKNMNAPNMQQLLLVHTFSISKTKYTMICREKNCYYIPIKFFGI